MRIYNDAEKNHDIKTKDSNVNIEDFRTFCFPIFFHERIAIRWYLCHKSEINIQTYYNNKTIDCLLQIGLRKLRYTPGYGQE